MDVLTTQFLDSELSYHEYLEKVRDFCPDIDPFMYMDDPKNWTA